MHTNHTTNYELSQFVSADKPTFLGDYNGDMLKIDTAIAGVATTASGAVSTANAASATATDAATAAASAASTAATADANASSALATAGNAATAAAAAQSDATAASTAASAADTKATAAQTDATAALGKVGDLTQLTTTDKTDLVAAINEVNAKPSGGTAADVTYDNTDSGLTATDVQAAIDELAQQGGGARVIATASAGQTWAAQLTYLKPYYDALSDSEKLHSVMRTSANVFSATQTDGKFTYVDVAAAARVNMMSLHLSNHTAFECVLTTNASTTEMSNNNNSNTLELIAL